MVRRAVSIASLFMMLTCAVGAAAGSAATTKGIFDSPGTMIVQFRTDFSPGTDFIAVRTTLVKEDDASVAYTQEKVAYTSMTWTTNVRVFEVDEIPPGLYRGSIEVVALDGSVVVGRSIVAEIDSGELRVVTVLATKPPAEAELVGVVDEAVEFPDQICPGDIIHYTATVSGEGVQRLTVPGGVGATLLPESVLSTHGDVNPDAPDGQVEVANLDLEEGETAVVKFDAIVAPVARQQAMAHVRVGDHEDFASAVVLSDDPATQDAGDATETELSDVCRLRDDLGQCQEEVDFLEFQVEKLEGTVSNLEGQLDALTGDPDGDGVIAARDRCPDTPPGAAVDVDGCSQAQFCAAVDMDQDNGANICRFADWLGDEPVGNPKDCHPKGGACDPT